MERYLVVKSVHVSILDVVFQKGVVLDWNSNTCVLLVDGKKFDFRPDLLDNAINLLKKKSFLELLPPVIEYNKDSLKTDTLCVMPILGCLSAAQKYLAKMEQGSDIVPVTDKQDVFLKNFYKAIPSLSQVKELTSMADKNASVINAWLKSQGFDIQLTEINDSNAFSVASILKLLVEWLAIGDDIQIKGKRTGSLYPGVKLKMGVKVFTDKRIHSYPVVSIQTKSGDIVKMSEVDGISTDTFALYSLAMKLNKVNELEPELKKVMFPMIELDVKPDISWICGLQAGNFHISEALQQTKFRMDLKGAQVDSAAAMTFRGLSMKVDTCIIGKPFIVWVERPGLKLPFFAALLCEDVWKKPSN